MSFFKAFGSEASPAQWLPLERSLPPRLVEFYPITLAMQLHRSLLPLPMQVHLPRDLLPSTACRKIARPPPWVKARLRTARLPFLPLATSVTRHRRFLRDVLCDIKYTATPLQLREEALLRAYIIAVMFTSCMSIVPN